MDARRGWSGCHQTFILIAWNSSLTPCAKYGVHGYLVLVQRAKLMLKPRDPRELVVALLSRSICSVQVACCLADGWGIHSWGHNHVGRNGLGEHAEVMTLRRANRKRLSRSTLYVAARRRRNGKVVTARPCEECQRALTRVGRVVWRDYDGTWKEFGGTQSA